MAGGQQHEAKPTQWQEGLINANQIKSEDVLRCK